MTLYVDYGLKRVEMPHYVRVEGASMEHDMWCKKNLKTDTFHYFHTDRAWYFVREKDAAFFALKWS